MCFTFKKNNKQTKKPVNCFLQDDASAGIQSLQTSIEIKLYQNRSDGLYSSSNLILELEEILRNGKRRSSWFLLLFQIQE